MITKEQEQTRTARDRRLVTAALAAAGIAGPVFFVVVALVQGRLFSSTTSEGPGVLPILTSHHAFKTSRAPSPYPPLPPEDLRHQGEPTRPMWRPASLPALLTLFAQWPWCKDFGWG